MMTLQALTKRKVIVKRVQKNQRKRYFDIKRNLTIMKRKKTKRKKKKNLEKKA